MFMSEIMYTYIYIYVMNIYMINMFVLGKKTSPKVIVGLSLAETGMELLFEVRFGWSRISEKLSVSSGKNHDKN